MPSSGTDFTFPSTPSSFHSMGLDVSVLDVLLSHHSTFPLGKSYPRSMICSIPYAKSVVLEPLVASKEADSLTSEDSKILYALRSRDILAETPSGLGVCVGKERYRGAVWQEGVGGEDLI